jgi:hypothetical protein
MKIKMNLIRKISIGRDYKNDAMHYSTGQEVFGGHRIVEIIEEDDSYNIFIEKNEEVLPWKTFNKNMAIAVEYNLQY